MCASLWVDMVCLCAVPCSLLLRRPSSSFLSAMNGDDKCSCNTAKVFAAAQEAEDSEDDVAFMQRQRRLTTSGPVIFSYSSSQGARVFGLDGESSPLCRLARSALLPH